MREEDRRERRRFVWTLVLTAVGTGILIELAIALMPDSQRHSLLVRTLTVWPLAVLLVYLSARGLARLSRRVDADAAALAAAEARIERIESLNTLLHRLASTSTVGALFQVLSSRIADLVPCDRVAVALSDREPEFQLVVAKSTRDDEGESPQVHHFLRGGTLVAEVADRGEPRLVTDLSALAVTCLDANVLASSGLRSAVILPLAAEGVTFGALIALSRRPTALTSAHIDTLRPVADVVAVAFATQTLARALGRSQMAKDIADVLFSLANEINGAMQAIVGHCELLSREYQDPALRRDLAMVSRQAVRATEVLAQVRELAEARLRRATSVANLLADARLEETAGLGPRFDDLLNR